MIFEVLTVAIITLLAQIVLTLRSVFLGSDSFMLITVERDRIYAVTRMNGIIASCFGVITISQFVLGLYMAACVAKGGRESVINRSPQLLLTSLFQRH